MRTEIALNDDLVREAMRYSKTKTKRTLIEDALISQCAGGGSRESRC